MSSDERYRLERADLEAELAAQERELECALAELGRAASPGSLVARHPYKTVLCGLALGFLIGWH